MNSIIENIIEVTEDKNNEIFRRSACLMILLESRK